jgi:hypothetical protein
MEVSLIQTTKGRDKLCVDGHMYVRKYTGAETIRWVCYCNRTKNCKGAVTTNFLLGVREDTIVDHNHQPDASQVAVEKARLGMKNEAKAASTKPSQIVGRTLQAASNDVRVNFGRLESAKRDLRHQRQRLRPAEPQSSADLLIPDDWKTTGDDQQHRFLLHDNHGVHADRMLVFATDEQLRTLADATVWHMDGTFSSCPAIFHQLYTIRTPLDSTAVTCVYAFLPNKSQATYEAFLRAVVDECQTRNLIAFPGRVVTDFEMAVVNAVTSVFGPQVCALVNRIFTLNVRPIVRK